MVVGRVAKLDKVEESTFAETSESQSYMGR